MTATAFSIILKRNRIVALLLFAALQPGLCQKATAQVNFSCPLLTQQSLQNGSATVTSSTIDIGNTANIFDGNDATLARSAAINPFIITLSFTNAINLTAVRVIQSHGSGWFRLEAADNLADLNNQNGSYQLLHNMINTPDGTPVVQPAVTSRKVFRLTLQRVGGDNFVHLNDWTLTGTVSYTADALVATPASIGMRPGWEIWLNKPGTSQCPQIAAVTGAANNPVSNQCINWSVSDPALLELNTTTMKLRAIKAGTANLIATIGTAIVTIPVTITRLTATGEPDLSVRYIKRLPEINYVDNSANPALDGWPAAGQPVSWRAHVRNWSANTYNNVSYEWRKNGILIASGTSTFGPDEEKTMEITQNWAFQRDSLEFIIDAGNSIPELSEGNNMLKIYTNAISLNLYVEQSLYDYFHVHQHQLGTASNSWDDWAQLLHVKRWNLLFQNAIHPDAPNGVLDRIRIDSIVIVPDNALPLAGGLPSNNPNTADKTVDLQWGFNAAFLNGTFYSNHTANNDGNPFYYEGSLLHELGHARYLIDHYGMDLSTAQVNIREGSVNIAGSPLLPVIAWDVVYYNQSGGLMSGPYTGISPYEARALNRIAYHRALCGNMNAPCNIGVFANDLPANNFITLKDQTNTILSNACVELYRAVPANGGAYNKNFDDIPEVNFTADASGIINVGRNPFLNNSASPLRNPALMDIILRVEKDGRVGYKVVEATDFNMEYWRGNTVNASYQVTVNMLPCTDFAGSSCTCTPVVVTPPVITAGGPVSFCEGGNVLLSSSAGTGNQWYKNGTIINGATTTTLIVTETGTYTARVTINGNQSAASNAMVITVNPVPATPVITQNGNQLTSNAATGNQWYLNNNPVPGAVSPSFTPFTSGNYSVLVTANSCPSAFSNVIAITLTGTPDLTNSQFFSTTQLTPGATVEEVVVIRNVGPTVTTAPVSFTATAYSPLTGLTISQNTNPSVTIGFTTFTLDNANWTFNPASGNFTSNAGITILPGTTRFIGIRITRAAVPGAGANGSVTHTITLTPGTGGGENPTNNNSISNTILKN